MSMRLAIPNGDVLDLSPRRAVLGNGRRHGSHRRDRRRDDRAAPHRIERGAGRHRPARRSRRDARGDERRRRRLPLLGGVDRPDGHRPQLGRCVLYRGEFAPRDALPRRRQANPLAFSARMVATAPPMPSDSSTTCRSARCPSCTSIARHADDATSSRRSRASSTRSTASHWNRLYGRRGFIQWQPVVPFGAESTLRHIVEALSSSGTPSFVSVLKRFGPGDAAHLSFPMAGWTLSTDLPVADGPVLGALLDDLDRKVADVGGRVYFAKDSRMRPELVPLMYPRLDEWRAVCATADPDGVMQSDLAAASTSAVLNPISDLYRTVGAEWALLSCCGCGG